MAEVISLLRAIILNHSQPTNSLFFLLYIGLEHGKIPNLEAGETLAGLTHNLLWAEGM